MRNLLNPIHCRTQTDIPQPVSPVFPTPNLLRSTPSINPLDQEPSQGGPPILSQLLQPAVRIRVPNDRPCASFSLIPPIHHKPPNRLNISFTFNAFEAGYILHPYSCEFASGPSSGASSVRSRSSLSPRGLLLSGASRLQILSAPSPCDGHRGPRWRFSAVWCHSLALS